MGTTSVYRTVLRSIRKAFPKADLVVGSTSHRGCGQGVGGGRGRCGEGGHRTGQHLHYPRDCRGGVPQLTAAYDCAQALAGSGVPVIADGVGIRYTGDVVVLPAAGGHSVMIGSMFAGVEESLGETVIYEGR